MAARSKAIKCIRMFCSYFFGGGGGGDFRAGGGGGFGILGTELVLGDGGGGLGGIGLPLLMIHPPQQMLILSAVSTFARASSISFGSSGVATDLYIFPMSSSRSLRR